MTIGIVSMYQLGEYEPLQITEASIIKRAERNWDDDHTSYGPYLIFACSRKVPEVTDILRNCRSHVSSLHLYCWDAKSSEEARRFCKFFTQNEISYWLVENMYVTRPQLQEEATR